MQQQPHALRSFLAIVFAVASAPCVLLATYLLLSQLGVVFATGKLNSETVMIDATVKAIIAAIISAIISFLVFRLLKGKPRNKTQSSDSPE